jgi:hypothetical protein
MRNIILLFLLICFNISAYSQIVKGRIHDQKTGSSVGFASVYLNGTLVGTLANQDGYFELDISKFLSMPLTISALGYYSVTVTNFPPDKALPIYLTPKVFELKEVVVSAKAYVKARKENIKLFKTQFLGQTLNALKCEITNIIDITFIYDSDTETLKAFSSKPILIVNNALGYNIIYYLDKFEFCKTNNSLILTGNYIFKEDPTSTKFQKQIFERKRKTAYLGSRMHFFRALWINDLDSSGFEIKNRENEKLNYDKLVTQPDRSKFADQPKYMKNLSFLYINYLSKWGGSVIDILKDSVYFDKHGYFDPFGINWDGEMAKPRIADLLPYDYLIK